MKIFRDLIYLMQGMMKAAHKFYKERGQYDFPQKKRGTIIKMYLVGTLISSPRVKAKPGNSINEGMIAPYKKVHDKVKKEAEKMKRCSWVNENNHVYVKYHDCEWGREIHDEKYLFEMLILEMFQAGLSWGCVLNKREAFRAVFRGFDPEMVSRFTEADTECLMADKRIIRNRRKIAASVSNAAAFIKIQDEFGSFDKYIWGFTDGKTTVNRDGMKRTTSPLSDRVSADLKRRGMSFVGSTVIYSYLQAIGVIDDHEVGCDMSK